MPSLSWSPYVSSHHHDSFGVAWDSLHNLFFSPFSGLVRSLRLDESGVYAIFSVFVGCIGVGLLILSLHSMAGGFHIPTQVFGGGALVGFIPRSSCKVGYLLAPFVWDLLFIFWFLGKEAASERQRGQSNKLQDSSKASRTFTCCSLQ